MWVLGDPSNGRRNRPESIRKASFALCAGKREADALFAGEQGMLRQGREFLLQLSWMDFAVGGRVFGGMLSGWKHAHGPGAFGSDFFQEREIVFFVHSESAGDDAADFVFGQNAGKKRTRFVAMEFSGLQRQRGGERPGGGGLQPIRGILEAHGSRGVLLQMANKRAPKKNIQCAGGHIICPGAGWWC